MREYIINDSYREQRLLEEVFDKYRGQFDGWWGSSGRPQCDGKSGKPKDRDDKAIEGRWVCLKALGVLETLKKEKIEKEREPKEQKEIFQNKQYWCRYFNYSKEQDSIKNVIMQYDRNCRLYNIFDIKGEISTPSSPPQQASLETTKKEIPQSIFTNVLHSRS